MSFNISIEKTNASKLDQVDFDNIPFGRVISDHMFEMEWEDGEWKNLSIHEVRPMELSPINLALHYGQSIFEGMKASISSDGVPLLLRPEMHVRRLNRSAERMCMPTMPEGLFIEALERLIWLDKDWIPTKEGSALYIRPIMFASDQYIGVSAGQNYKFFILTLPVGPYYSKPVSLLVEEKYVRAVDGGVGEAKTAGNYAASLLPAKLAREKGYDQVIWMDAHEFKYIQEVGTMNLFFVFKDKVVTPATDGSILHGITRDSFLHMLSDWGYATEQRKISIDEVVESYKSGDLIEVFGAGTAAVSTQVQKITYRDEDLIFDESKWELSLRLKDALNGIRCGKVDDKFGWISRVEELVPAS